MGCDLANDLIRDPTWTPQEFVKYLPTTVPIPNRGDSTTRFQPTKPMAVAVPPNDVGKCDVFIDDYLLVTPDFGNQADRAAVLLPLVILCWLDRQMPTTHSIEKLFSCSKRS
jgi:hypothetical protein